MRPKHDPAVISIALVLLLLLGALWLFGSDVLDRPKRYALTELDEGWTVMRNGEELPYALLSEQHLSGLQPGDILEARLTLPDEDIDAAALKVTDKQAVAHLYVNDSLFFEYGSDLLKEGRMLKRGFLIAPLPDDWQGAELLLHLRVTEPKAFSVIGPVILGNTSDIYDDFLEERRLPMLLGIFLVIYAVFQFLWLPYLFFQGRQAVLSPMYGALITLVLGIYLLGNYDVIDLLTRSASTILEYGALYLIPGLFAAYLALLQTGRTKQICNLCALVDLAFFAAAVLLHRMGLVHITLFLTIFYVIALIESILFFIGMYGNLRLLQRTRSQELDAISDYAIFAGFTVFVVCAFVDVIFYLLERFLSFGWLHGGIPFMMFGSIVFTITLTAQFFLHGVSHLRADVTRGRLEERAYQDPLTGLANRIRCEQKMTELKMDTPFVLISLDVDGLKAINDSYGHAEGDRMLQGFAKTLETCFSGMTLVGRMGGDEFLVILTGSECVVTDAKLRELDHALFNRNLDEPQFRYSVSYGYASNTETHFGNRVRDIYMLADRRMYDMKRKKKQEKEAADEAF